jgi:hypothetical protein
MSGRFQPRPAPKLPFGLWTVGNPGSAAFGQDLQ